MGRRARNKCEPVALAGVIDRRERVNNGSCLFAEGGSFCFCFVFSAKGLKGVAKTIASERTVSGLHYFSFFVDSAVERLDYFTGWVSDKRVYAYLYSGFVLSLSGTM